MTPDDIVHAVVSNAPNCELTSRVRLQKTVYLLDQLGFNSGLDFEYHYYGPYARELDVGIEDADILNKVREEIRCRRNDGASYSHFKASGTANNITFGKLKIEGAKQLIRRFANENVTVLELAATVDWLWRHENCVNWQEEIKRRKGAKVKEGRLDKAIKLLRDIGLSPPEGQPLNHLKSTSASTP